MEERRFVSAAEILASEDIKIEEVEVPEWGGYVRLRPMSGEEAMKFIEVVQKDKSGSAIKVVAMCAVKEDGSPLFSEADVAQLYKKSLRAIMRLQKAALRINGLKDEEGLEQAKND